MKKLSALILFIFIFFFAFAKSVSAIDLFEDNFNDGNADGWTVEYLTPSDPNDPVWQIFKWVVNTDKQYGITLNDRQLRTFSSAGNISWTDYIYKVKMLGKNGVDKNILFRYQNKNNWYGFHMLPSGVYFGMSINGSYSDTYVSNFSFVNDVPYELKIVLSGGFVSFYANNSPVVENYSMWSNPLTNGKIALYVSTGEQYPSSVWFDNILVCDEELCEPIPTTTPTPTPLQPLILLPGLGASWNHDAMILDQEKPPEEWYMTPGVNSYNGIIQTFQNAGYTLGDNFFVFNYDWRQPIEDIAEDLKNYITTNINPPPEEKIDLVGHSLGGMVARTYLQNHPSDHQVDQLITLGSPHHGVPQVYYLWEGADLNKTFKYAWMRIGAGILIQLKKHGFVSNVETVRQIVPGLKNLLPDFPYLKKDGVPKPIEGMNQQNQWLANMNALPLPGHLISRLTTLLGLKGDTLHWIGIKPPDWFDQLLGRWEDGKPINEEFNMGDDSVLVTSGQLEGAEVIDLEGLDHGDLVESVTGQQQIVNKLGLSPTSIVPTSEISLEPALVFQLASPATIAVFGPNGWQIGEGVSNNIPGGIYSSADKLIIIPEPFEGNYETRVTGEGGGGNYRLLIGNVNPKNDFWREEDGQLGNGETKTHQINYNSQPKLNKIDLLKLAKTRLTEAKAKADTCRYPARLTLKGTIQSINEQVNMVIYLVKLNQEALAEKQLKLVIRSLVNLERNFKFVSLGCKAETQQEILFSLRQARDYLIQALEI